MPYSKRCKKKKKSTKHKARDKVYERFSLFDLGPKDEMRPSSGTLKKQ